MNILSTHFFHYVMRLTCKVSTFNLIQVIFMVARMSLSDYDYGGGLALSSTYPIWWQMLSFVWIVVAALIILNLLVALMADSYNRLSDASELQGRLCQARFISEYERYISYKAVGQKNVFKLGRKNG